jgi:transposase
MWLKKRRELGPQALRKQRQGRPAGKKKISRDQARQVARLVLDKTPGQLKLPFMLWTREAVRDLARERTGVTASLMTVGRWLQEWGFTPRKPVRRAFEQDPEAARRWLDQECHAIRRAAKREGAEIHWGDEMGMRSDHQSPPASRRPVRTRHHKGARSVQAPGRMGQALLQERIRPGRPGPRKRPPPPPRPPALAVLARYSGARS